MQVDPIKPTLKAPGSNCLKLKCDEPLSNFAFKFNLRRHTMVSPNEAHAEETSQTLRFASRAKKVTNKVRVNEILTDGRGLHSSTFQLKLSRI